jgi:Trehalose utilisation
MRKSLKSRLGHAGILIALSSFISLAQMPPPESTSKVKRVLLYSKNGGWSGNRGAREETIRVFIKMAQAKGFELDTSDLVSDLNLENLKNYQVIVWNNNMNGAASVPDSSARNAVAEYVKQGGGWLLVNTANDHAGSWPFMNAVIGPGTSGWRGNDTLSATLVRDSSARNHPELRFVVNALPDSITLRTNWLSVPSSVEGMRHIQVLYRFGEAPWIANTSGAIPRPVDEYVWAAIHVQGRALAMPLGWHLEGYDSLRIMEQSDSVVPKLYWQGLRWLAGDFKGGCTDSAMVQFDPEARVDNGSCASSEIGVNRAQAKSFIQIVGRHMFFPSPGAGMIRLRILDLKGRPIGTWILPHTASEFELPSGLVMGLYFFEFSHTNVKHQARILIQ